MVLESEKIEREKESGTNSSALKEKAGRHVTTPRTPLKKA